MMTFAGGFLGFLNLYLKATSLAVEKNPYLQKSGVCIGSFVALLLSRFVIANIN